MVREDDGSPQSPQRESRDEVCLYQALRPSNYLSAAVRLKAATRTNHPNRILFVTALVPRAAFTCIWGVCIMCTTVPCVPEDWLNH